MLRCAGRYALIALLLAILPPAARAAGWRGPVLLAPGAPAALLAEIPPAALRPVPTAAIARACPPDATVVLPAEALRDPAAESALEAALRSRATVLLPEGLPEGLDGLAGLRVRPLPPWCTQTWLSPALPLDLGGPAEWRQTLLCLPELVAGARVDPLAAVGRLRERPESLTCLALRYYEGERAGARLVVAAGGCPESVRWEPLLARLDEPYLLCAEPDYPLVRAGEDIRIHVEARIVPADRRPTRIEVRIPGHRRLRRSLWTGPTDSWERETQREGRPDRLAGDATVPGEAWPTGALDVEARIFARNGDLLDSLRSRVAVWPDRLPARPKAASVTNRRIAVDGSLAPTFVAGPLVALAAFEPWSPLRGDLWALAGLLDDQADAGARSVRLASASDPAGERPEWRRRANQALGLFASARRLAPELVLGAGTVEQGVYGEGGAAEALAPVTLLTAADPDDEGSLRAMWPPERLTPRPESADPHSGAHGLAAEIALRSGVRPVRAASTGAPTPRIVWEAILLGSAGATVEGPRDRSDDARILEANVVARLIQPGTSWGEVPILIRDPADAAAPLAAGAAVGEAGYAWAPVDSTDSHGFPLAPLALLAPEPGPLAAAMDAHLAAWVTEGGNLLGPAERLPPLMAEPGAPGSSLAGSPAWRQGRGRLIAWEPEPPGSGQPRLAEILGHLGGTPLAETAGPGLRLHATTAGDGSALVGALAHPDAPVRRLTLHPDGLPVSVGLSGACPGAASADERGLLLVTGCGGVSVEGRPLLVAPDACRLTLISLEGAPLGVSESMLLFVDAPGPVELLLHRDGSATRTGLRMRSYAAVSGALVTIGDRALDRRPDGERIRVAAEDLCTPILLAPGGALPIAERRLAELIWGSR